MPVTPRRRAQFLPPGRLKDGDEFSDNTSEHNDEKRAGSKPTRKRSPTETLDAILESDLHDEAERILALSDEELDRELVEAGFDPERVRAHGRAIYERTRQLSSVEKAVDRGSDKDAT